MAEIFEYQGEQLEIDLNDQIVDLVDLLTNTTQSIFITGKAGTGKSTLIKYLVHKSDKEIAVLAFTGLASINIGG